MKYRKYNKRPEKIGALLQDFIADIDAASDRRKAMTVKLRALDEKRMREAAPAPELEFHIPGIPGHKGRPKFARMAGFVKTYTDKKTVTYENLVKLMAHQAGAVLIDGPLMMSVTAIWPLATAKHRKRTPVGSSWRTSAPDVDNVFKVVADALNGIAYKDDSQIAHATIITITAAQDSKDVGVYVKIQKLSAGPDEIFGFPIDGMNGPGATEGHLHEPI